MNITLDSDELDIAIIDYLNKLGVNTKGKECRVYIDKEYPGRASANIRIEPTKEDE